MIIGELKNKVGRVWDAFWPEGISNPLDVAPQGPDGLFDEADVDRMVAILHSVRATAAPVVEVA